MVNLRTPHFHILVLWILHRTPPFDLNFTVGLCKTFRRWISAKIDKRSFARRWAWGRRAAVQKKGQKENVFREVNNSETQMEQKSGKVLFFIPVKNMLIAREYDPPRYRTTICHYRYTKITVCIHFASSSMVTWFIIKYLVIMWITTIFRMTWKKAFMHHADVSFL